jgi:hypothetical protein
VLNPAPSAAQAAASSRATVGPLWSCGFHTLKITASMTAPRVCPVRRAVLNMPLAAPARCGGGVVTMVWLLGD